MKFLLTGAAGFIGMHTAQRLLARGDTVVGVDNLNDYYDVSLKHARLARLSPGRGQAMSATGSTGCFPAAGWRWPPTISVPG